MSASALSHLYNEEVYVIPPSITVVINRPWEMVPDEQRALLAKILGSVKVSLSSVRILHRASVTNEDLVALGSKRFLIFGSQASYNPYESVQAQGFTVIRADELSALDDAKKKSLWLALKSMFGV